MSSISLISSSGFMVAMLLRLVPDQNPPAPNCGQSDADPSALPARDAAQVSGLTQVFKGAQPHIGFGGLTVGAGQGFRDSCR